ncbi:conserved protein of unknown function (plasmid) [Cupriavidus neocaledonicus]|uniref:Uncharacterized protein n=1 Tax=Cupriavidus neocaledonicus TaxID=1040979 RepID=A0A375HQG1_9BURK|nr:hypothetical protein CBM2605_B100149 [Cupriavidus neocaledonicus]SPD60162.1 conserved protein of unknown function [Cupriavidus neocaledonicus]
MSCVGISVFRRMTGRFAIIPIPEQCIGDLSLYPILVNHHNPLHRNTQAHCPCRAPMPCHRSQANAPQPPAPPLPPRQPGRDRRAWPSTR